HFVAGAVAGFAGALVTSPLDVIKTRLQSDYYANRIRPTNVVVPRTVVGKGLHHFADTFRMIGEISRTEGTKALFRGLGPNLLGIVPARSINFFSYGTGKRLLSDAFYDGKENSMVHLSAAAIAGIITSTATNPIWLVKTRLQLDKAHDVTQRQYSNSFDCLKKVLKQEGLRGLYKGLTASYLGVSESIIQWTTYEYFKGMIARRTIRRKQQGLPDNTTLENAIEWAGKLGAAAGAKLVAAGFAYPHEVIRTRLRQLPPDGRPKYTGLVQCFKLVLKEEGASALYGGMTAHLLRVVPSAAILFGTYELVVELL
ncbi:mitochondrial carrier domain-containing protein, partial [Protomyces lactucae-debilis]